MENNSGNAGTAGTTGAEDLAVILSNFGTQTIANRRSTQRVVTWTSPTLGRCVGAVPFVSGSGWLVVTLPERDAVIWVRDTLVTDSVT